MLREALVDTGVASAKGALEHLLLGGGGLEGLTVQGGCIYSRVMSDSVVIHQLPTRVVK